jgi:metal-dependent amidase/aminoacylase/carboxypeptidase family protein
VTAAHTIARLQTIASREVDPADSAVVTVSAIHAGDAENVIPARADLKLNIRTIDPDTRKRVLRSVKRIIDAESQASGIDKTPELTETTNFPFLNNDREVTEAVARSFGAHFGDSHDENSPRLGGSEDFGILATAVGRPACFWTYGGVDQKLWDKAKKEGRLFEDVPVNHSPFFAPVIQPTLKAAVDAYALSALTFLRAEKN